MDADDLYETVREEGDLESTDEARTAIDAVLTTLAERVTEGEVADLAERLPGEVTDPLEAADSPAGEAEPFPFEEFLDRVADRAGADDETALSYARAVFGALREHPGADELARAREQLPDEFDLAFEPGAELSTREFLATVEEGAPAGADARALAEATLATLGERVSGGEAADLATYLPAELREPLVEADDERPPAFGVAEFRRRVADRTGLPADDAEQGVRAVAAALSEAVADRELEAVRSQLPAEYDSLL